jgi:sugar lactone lactonase YvrE
MRVRTALLGAAIASLGAAAPASAGETCEPWAQRTVASGLGSLENLEPDGRGGMFISASSRRAILRLTPDGRVETAVAGVNAPGGQRVRGSTLFFNTGDSAASGLNGTPDGTIDTFDLDTRRRATYSSGLTMPNGLVFLPNGDAVVSRDLGTGTRLTRIPASDPRRPQSNWAGREDHNGLAVDTSGTFLYADETFTPESSIWRIRINRPTEITRVARLGNGGTQGLDDMTIDRRNNLYVTAQVSASIIRVNPRTGEFCTIATGLQNPSAVKFGRGPGWPSRNLYVTGFDGTVRELTPPAGYRAPDARPRIAARAKPRRLRARVSRRVTFRVSAFGEPLRSAVVRVAGRRRLTNSRGRAVIRVRFTRRGRRFATVSKKGFARKRVPVRVR